MYLIYMGRFAFNYQVSHYYLKKMEEALKKQQSFIETDEDQFILYGKKFLYYAEKCTIWQAKCDQLKETICNKYPFLKGDEV